jgi:hypothetical protein
MNPVNRLADDLVESTVPDAADMPLEKYDAARRALADACNIDDVLHIRNIAVAAQVYARQAQDRELLDRAIDLRMRGERKAGEMLRDLAKTGERARRGGDRRIKVDDATLKPRTLEDLGIKKHQSVRYQKSADLSQEEFEERVEVAKEKAAGIKVKFDRPKSEPDHRAKLIRRLNAAIRCGEEMIPIIDEFDPDAEIDDLFDRMAEVWGFISRERRKQNQKDEKSSQSSHTVSSARLDADNDLDIPPFLDRRPRAARKTEATS